MLLNKTLDFKNAVILSEGEPVDLLSPQDSPEPQPKNLPTDQERA